MTQPCVLLERIDVDFLEPEMSPVVRVAKNPKFAGVAADWMTRRSGLIARGFLIRLGVLAECGLGVPWIQVVKSDHR